MQVREAKDFLVQETAKQAGIEGVPLSKLEKRMMYFTENEEMSEDPLALNDEFEAKYDTEENEAALMHGSRKRILKRPVSGSRRLGISAKAIITCRFSGARAFLLRTILSGGRRMMF